MKKYKNTILSLLLVTLAVFLVGCSLGPRKTFLTTQTTFNDMVSDYVTYYEASSPDEQAKLKENVTPKVVEALDLLTSINESIRLGVDPSKIDQERFRELRYDLYRMLPKIFGKEN